MHCTTSQQRLFAACYTAIPLCVISIHPTPPCSVKATCSSPHWLSLCWSLLLSLLLYACLHHAAAVFVEGLHRACARSVEGVLGVNVDMKMRVHCCWLGRLVLQRTVTVLCRTAHVLL
jgi:hypothetical protein